MQHAITHVPPGHKKIVSAAVRLPGMRCAYKGRGPRPSRRFHASLPSSMSTHFTAYVDGAGDGSAYPKVYWRYIGWNEDKGKPHVVLL